MANSIGGSVVWNLDVDPSKFEAGLRKAHGSAESFGSSLNKIDFKAIGANAGNTFNGIADSIANVAKKLAILTVGSGGLGAVFVKSAGDLQLTSKSFEILIGNADRANRLFAEIKRFADATPFQFPELAKAAQKLLGYGISVDDVFSRLKMLGDIAAVTGADLGSLATVFGQVTGAGRLMGQDALQLVNNNIPITTILTKKLGISAMELRKRIEEGAISTAIFTEALQGLTTEGGIAFQGTEVLAKTFNGRMSTLKDTVMEFGRNLLGVKVDPELGFVVKPGGVFDLLSQAIPKITASLTELTPKLTAFVETIVRNGDTVVAVLSGIVTAFIGFKILGTLAPIIGTFMGLLKGTATVAAVGPLAAAIGALGGPVVLIGVAVVALAAGLAFLQVKFNIFGKAIKFLEPVLNIIKGVFSDLWTSIKDLATVIGKELAPVFAFVSKHAEVFKKIGLVLLAIVFAPLIIAVGAFVAGIKLLAIVLGFIAKHFQTIKKVVVVLLAVALAPLIAIIAPIVLLIKNWGNIMNWLGMVFSTIGSTIMGVMSAVWNFIKPILEFILNLYIIVFGSILLVILTVLTVIKSIVFAVWNFIFGVISTVLGWIWDRITTAFNFYKNIIVTVFTAVWDFISMIWDKIYGVISGVVQRIIDFFAPAFNWLYDKGKAIVQGLIDGVRAMANAVWEAIKVVSGKIGEFFSGAWNWLYDTGKAIVQGFINGIKDMINKVKEAAGDIGEAVKSKVKGLLGINSPSKVFYGYGKNITQGLTDGIDSGMAKVDMAAKELSMGIQAPNMETDMSDSNGNISSPVINIQPNFSGIVARSRGEWRDIMKDGIESINEELRSRNLPELGNGKLAGSSNV